MYEIGSTLGNYKLLSLLGDGGAGSVYLGMHTGTGQRVAIKVPHQKHLKDRELLTRFFREARSINAVRHENVVDIVEFVEREDVAYYAMEFLDGATLDDLIDSDPQDLELIDRLRIAGQISSGLTAAHRVGVIHRDLKPANVVIVARPFERYFVKLLDFGAALLRKGGQLSLEGNDGVKTMVGHVIGTPGYMAPEALIGDKCDHRVDIYAFGVILYELVANQQPFDAPTVNKLLMKHVSEKPRPINSIETPYCVPDELSDLALACLAKKPEDRPREMREVGAALVRITNRFQSPSSAEIIVKSDPTPTGVTPTKPDSVAKRRRWPRTLALFTLLISALGYLGWTRHVARTLPPQIDRFYAIWARAVARLLPVESQPAGDTRTPRPVRTSPLPERTAVHEQAATVKAAIAMVSNEDDRPYRSARREKRKGRKGAGRQHRHKGFTVYDGGRPVVSSDMQTARRSTAEHEMPAPGAPESGTLGMSIHEAHYRQGKLYLRQGKPLLAVESLARCLAAAPDFAPAYRALGAANLALGRKSQAIEAYRRFLVLDPDHSSAAEVESIIERTLDDSGA